jgi:hypothetical protein
MKVVRSFALIGKTARKGKTEEVKMRTSFCYYYYRVVSHRGTGDTYYTFARSAAEAREKTGFEFVDASDRPTVVRCSKKEAMKTGYGIHRRF